MTEGPLDESTLLLAYARTGDQSALGELVQRCFPNAYRFALRVLGDPSTAEDAVAESFVVLMRDARRFDPRRPFEPWWRGIVTNRVRFSARLERRRLRRETRVAAMRPHSVEPDVGRALESQEIFEHVHRLPVDVRLPIVLHYYEGLSHQAVGDALGCPTGTASSRIRRGLAELREMLVGAGFAVLPCNLEPALRASGAASSTPVLPTPPQIAKLEVLVRRATLRSVAVRVLGMLATGVLVVALGVSVVLHSQKLSANAPRPSASEPLASVSGSQQERVADQNAQRADFPPVDWTTSPHAPNAATPPAPVHSRTDGTLLASAPCPPATPSAPLRGRVLDAVTHEPIQGAVLYVTLTGPLNGRRRGRASWLGGVADAHGEFVIEAKGHLVHGNTTIDLRDAGATLGLVVRADGHEPLVRVLSGEKLPPTLTLVLSRGTGRRVAGRVVQQVSRTDAGEQQTPVAEVVVGIDITVSGEGARATGAIEGETALASDSVQGLHFFEEVKSGTDGTFALNGLPAGQTKVYGPNDERFAFTTRDFEPSAETTHIVLTVVQGAQLVVQRLGWDVQVDVVRVGAVAGTSCFHTKGGPCTFSHLEPGDYEVRVGPPRDALVTRPGSDTAPSADDVQVRRVRLAAGDDQILTFLPDDPHEPVGQLTCRVYREDGSLATHVEVWLGVDPGNDWNRFVKGWTNAHGEVTFDGLAPGRYKLQVSALAKQPPLETVELNLGAARVDLRIPNTE